MLLRNLLLVVHIAVTAGALGMDLVLLSLGLAGRLGADPTTIYPAALLIGTWLLAPVAALSLVTGLLLTWTTAWKLTRHWWVATKLAITVALNGAVLFVLLPRLRELAEAATPPAVAALSDADRFFLVAATSGSASLLLLSIVLAVFKPRWPFRRSTEGIAPAS